MEDDAYPFEKFDVGEEIEKVLSEVPEDWEIIKLHCDPHCTNGSNKHALTNGSTASYLINTRGLEKLKNLKLEGHIDAQQSMYFNIYKSKVNLFWTDEKKSTNRKDGTYWLTHVFNFFNPVTSGEKTFDDILSFKLFRIPFTNIELTNYQIILILILVVILMILIIFKIRER